MTNLSDRRNGFSAGRFTSANRGGKYINANSNVFGAGSRIPRQDLGYHIQLFAKRALDVTASATAIIVLLPAFIILAILIRLDSPGPVFFRQVRWGQGGKKIRVFKFRSMRTDLGDPSGVAQTVKNDPRITRIGATLRRTNLDELPQLINVLRGDMSLIGPRCHAVNMLAAGRLYEDLVPEYHRRHTMRPGITGLAQMRGLRGPTDRADKARARIACDIHYVDRFNLWLDMKILVGTVISEIKGGNGF
jgi:lipopolysaccharide/colanic/teichoic acid biosynthesis glycosyltransferase